MLMLSVGLSVHKNILGPNDVDTLCGSMTLTPCQEMVGLAFNKYTLTCVSHTAPHTDVHMNTRTE